MVRAILLFAALLLSNSVKAESYDLVVRNVTVIDAVSEPREGQSVYVANGKIQLVSGDSTHAARQVIDGTGKFLMPGLWDMHVHIVYEKALVTPMPELFLDYGVTSVRDTGALLHEIAPEVKRWQELGAQAPDLFFSGPLLDGSLVVYDGEGRPEIGIRNQSIERALSNFEVLREAGVDFIKIYELVSPEVFYALVEAAGDAGLPIAAHVPLSMRADAAGSKVQSMEHLRNVDLSCSEAADALFEKRAALIQAPGERTGYELRSYLHQSQRAQAYQAVDTTSPTCREVINSLRNTIQVPTLRLNTITEYSPIDRQDWQSHLNNLPEITAKQWLETAKFYYGRSDAVRTQLSQWSMALVAAMIEAGVPVGAGTDTPIGQAIPGYSLHTELERLVDAGMSTKQALAAATIRPAEFFNLESEKGQIQPGMEADLLLLEKNPLQDIRHSRSILNVISNGVVVR